MIADYTGRTLNLDSGATIHTRSRDGGVELLVAGTDGIRTVLTDDEAVRLASHLLRDVNLNRHGVG